VARVTAVAVEAEAVAAVTTAEAAADRNVKLTSTRASKI